MKQKIARVMAFVLAMALVPQLTGCTNVIKEQWQVVEKYRLENTTTEKQEKTEEATTEDLPEQVVLADYIDESGDTLGLRVIVPNGYKRVGEATTEAEKSGKKAAKSKTTKQDSKDATTKEPAATTTTEQTTTSEASAVSTTQVSAYGAASSDAAGVTIQDDSATTENGETTEATTEARVNTSGEVYTMAQAMRTLPVKKAGEEVMLYTGAKKEKQDSYIAILDLPLDKGNLQQRSSTIMRLYGEYFWMNRDYDNLGFSLLSNFNMDYNKWIAGNRLAAGNGTFCWYEDGDNGDTYDNFLEYMQYYFKYTGMDSLLAASKETKAENISVGDFFTDEKKENAAMVVDVAEDSEGDRCFLLASGGSPAQDMEILKNPAHEDPWYYVSELKDTFETPEFTLSKKLCYHLNAENGTKKNTVSSDAASKDAVSKDALTQ